MPSLVRGFHAGLLAIAAAGLAIRVAYTVLVADDVGGLGDYFFYHDSANFLAEGRGFINPFALATGPAEPTAEHPPLWSFVLAITSLLGGTGFQSHKLTGCIVGAAAIVVVGLLARRVAGDRAGLVAAGIAAVYPTLIAADGSLMSETLYGLLVGLALLAAYRFRDRPGWAMAAVIGGLLGLAALTRGEALLLLPLLALVLCLGEQAPWRRRVLRFAAICAGAAVVILPWTVRNWAAFDRPVLVSINGSAVIAGANCDSVYSGENMGFWDIECTAGVPRSLSEPEKADVWRERGVDYALDHPGRLPAVGAVRVLRVWDFWQPWRQTLAEGRDRTVQAVGTGMFYLLLPLAAWGLVLLRRRDAPLSILLAPAVAVTLSALLGWGLPRFRHAAEIPLVVLAAVVLARPRSRPRS
jgi:asparagine N-glycosylation enzyme membrane subunit Stt3